MRYSRILLALGAALAMGALGCNEDGTNGSDSPPPVNPPKAQALTYPAGPYNVQPGDVVATHADVSALKAWTGVSPQTALSVGIARFVEWYKRYYVCA